MDPELASLVQMGQQDISALRMALQSRLKEESEIERAGVQPTRQQPKVAKAVDKEVKANSAGTHVIDYMVLGRTFKLASSRVMGKVMWPGAAAVARYLLSDSYQALQHEHSNTRTFVELGAGCALPSLVAASSDLGFSRVVATDFSDEVCSVITTNAELNQLSSNGSTPFQVCLLDFADATKLTELCLSVRSPHEIAMHIVISASDISYDDAYLQSIFASSTTCAQQACRQNTDSTIDVIIGRSAVHYESMDDQLVSLASQHDFHLARPLVVDDNAAGIFHSTSASHFEPNTSLGGVFHFRYHPAQV